MLSSGSAAILSAILSDAISDVVACMFARVTRREVEKMRGQCQDAHDSAVVLS